MQGALDSARAIAYQHVLLDGLVHAAILAATGDAECATLLLAQALIHPASRSDTTAQAQSLLAHCEERIAPQTFAAAVARGRETTLAALVDEVLALPDVVGKAEP